jgi:hypothetical protein
VGFRLYNQESTKVCAVMGVPSLQVTPWRSLNVITELLLLKVQLSATPGAALAVLGS